MSQRTSLRNGAPGRLQVASLASDAKSGMVYPLRSSFQGVGNGSFIHIVPLRRQNGWGQWRRVEMWIKLRHNSTAGHHDAQCDSVYRTGDGLHAKTSIEHIVEAGIERVMNVAGKRAYAVEKFEISNCGRRTDSHPIVDNV